MHLRGVRGLSKALSLLATILLKLQMDRAKVTGAFHPFYMSTLSNLAAATPQPAPDSFSPPGTSACPASAANHTAAPVERGGPPCGGPSGPSGAAAASSSRRTSGACPRQAARANGVVRSRCPRSERSERTSGGNEMK